MNLALLLAACLYASPEDTLKAETRLFLKELVRFDTSNPPGNELPAAEYIKGKLDEVGIQSRIYVSTGTRASLIARLPGKSAKNSLVLMCHTDVVPAEASEWSTPPFEPVERDGYLYGRGTADIKSMCAAQLALMRYFKRSKKRLPFDLIYFAEADEENGGAVRHIQWLLREHGDQLSRARWAINEGGNTIWENGRVTEIRVQAAEKEFMDVTLKAAGTAGHASVPRPDNAIFALSRALERLSEWRAPAELNPVVRGFLERQKSPAAVELNAAIDAVLAAKPGPELDAAADRLTRLNLEFGAILRDTITPTILKAGFKSNVIPAEAEAVLNARLMPGRDPRELLDRLRAAIDDPSIEITAVPPSRKPVQAMPIDTPLYEAAAAAAPAGVAVAPFMAAWTTDSQDLRGLGVIVYGIDPPLSLDDGERVHGNDERILLAGLDWYVVYIRDLLLKLR